MRAGFLLLLLVVPACAGDRGPQRLEIVDDNEVLAFVDRIEAFYEAIEQRPLDAYATFEDEELRGYFAGASEFADYYASLAQQVRVAGFRQARAERVRVRRFRFEAEDLARVEVILEGHHDRPLRFWQLELERVDTWRRSTGGWVLSPDKL